MQFTIEGILWYLVFIDSVFTNLIIWVFPKWYEKKFKNLSKSFPAGKGWSLWYLILVLWIGYALLRLGYISAL
mgnify:CR=1 FL=1